MTRLIPTLLLLCSVAQAQFGGRVLDEFKSDDLVIGGDIFDNFNENLEAQEVLEDERFLRYGRFFTLNMGLGLTDFTGNRGQAYQDQPPTLNFSVMAFTNFRTSFVLGLSYSKHSMFFPSQVEKDSSPEGGPLGLVEVNILRTYTGFRYYIDTSDLNTALTYSNPYFSMRFEYWNLNNEFIDRSDLADDEGGGLGIGFGGGLEFPIRLKRSYINYEFLVHTVNFHDRLTNDYQPIEDQGFGFNNLTGLGVSSMLNYVISW